MGSLSDLINERRKHNDSLIASSLSPAEKQEPKKPKRSLTLANGKTINLDGNELSPKDTKKGNRTPLFTGKGYKQRYQRKIKPFAYPSTFFPK